MGMQNIYCNAKYRGKVKSFPSIHGESKILKALAAWIFFLWKLDSWFLALVLGLSDFWGDSFPFEFKIVTCWRS